MTSAAPAAGIFPGQVAGEGLFARTRRHRFATAAGEEADEPKSFPQERQGP